MLPLTGGRVRMRVLGVKAPCRRNGDGRQTMRRRGNTPLAAITAAVLCAVVIGCSGVTMTDLPALSSALELTDAQAVAVRPSIDRIASAVSHYEADHKAFAESARTGRPAGGVVDVATAPRAAMREDLRRLRAKRAAYQAVIDDAVATIAAMLNAEQRKRFADVDKPELDAADPPVRPGGSRRPSRVGGLGELGGLGSTAR